MIVENKGGSIVWLDEIDSTNKYALERFEELQDGALVCAMSQTAGRGRHQRVWQSPPGENVYASFVVKNFPDPIHRASWIGSLAVLDTFAELLPELEVWLKWPNDVYCGERKIAGLLCEGYARGGCRGVVIGMGVNINMPAEALDRIDQPATSVLRETGHELNLKKFIKLLDKHLLTRYITASNSIDRVYQEWKAGNKILGRTIEIVDDRDGGILQGKVLDIGFDGELYFDLGQETVRLYSGDVRIKKDSLFR